MSEIVIRHAEPKDAEAIRQIMHPEVYHDTLQLPHPSGNVARTATDQPAKLVACMDALSASGA
jgi:putative acetyltransferase